MQRYKLLCIQKSMTYNLVRYLHKFIVTLNNSQAMMENLDNSKVLGINWRFFDVFSIDQQLLFKLMVAS